MRKVIILCPTHGRPREFVRMVASAQATCTAWNWEIRGLVEKDDVKLQEYFAGLGRVEGVGDVDIEIMESKGSKNCVVEQWERMKNEVGADDIICLFGDDIMFASFGWDEMIMKAMPADGIGISYCRDNEIFDMLHMIIGVGLLKVVGYIMYPTIEHYYGDSWWRKLGIDAGIMYPISDMFLFHLHSKVAWPQLRATVTDAYRKNNDGLKADQLAFVRSYGDIAKLVQKIKKAKIDFECVPRTEWIIDERNVLPKERTDKVFEDWMQKAKAREVQYYKKTDSWLFEALDKYFTGGDVLIVGAYEAWYESVMLAYGARSVDVLEIKRIGYEGKYPVRYLLELPEKKYDAVLCISTLEHVGLGRYGDELDVDGDIKMMKKLGGVTAGLLFLAVPLGEDHLVFNAHRIYGSKRIPKILEGWTVLKYFGLDEVQVSKKSTSSGYQPVMVLKKKEA